MNRKNVFLLTLLCGLSLSVQAIPPIRVSRAVTRVASGVVARSARANMKAIARLRNLTKLANNSPKVAPKLSDPALLRRSVFEVQFTETGRHTASAFALNVNGRTWGVAAAHVMKKIGAIPFAKVRTETGNILAPISSFRMSNQHGADVAVFEIPQEILPHIEILSPAEKLPSVGKVAETPAFINENYTLLPAEDILFVGQHRILLRDQLHSDITGFCGSPVLVDGKVVGLRIGAYPLQNIQKATWNSLFYANNLSLKTPMHIVSPIEHALQLIEEMTAQTTGQNGTLLKVLDHPVHLMSSQEYISSVTHLRNGSVRKEIHMHPFMNFDNLGEFFELQENDVVRITLQSPRPYSPAMVTKIFDVNVSTGEVTSLVR